MMTIAANLCCLGMPLQKSNGEPDCNSIASPGWSATICPEEHTCSCPGDAPSGPPSLTLADVDYCVMHSPFVKMVRKGFARIFYQDHLRADIRRTARQVMLGRASALSYCSNWSILRIVTHLPVGSGAGVPCESLKPRRRSSCSTEIIVNSYAADLAAGIALVPGVCSVRACAAAPQCDRPVNWCC